MTPRTEWERMRWFTASEFPDPVELAHPALFYALDDYRELLGCKVEPSRAPGALARTTGSSSSRHAAEPGGRGKLSDAADVFPDCDPARAWLTALAMPCWGGIGIYFDTRGNDGQPHYMLHLDLRPIGAGGSRVLWWRDAGEYHYPASATALMQLRDMIEEGGP